MICAISAPRYIHRLLLPMQWPDGQRFNALSVNFCQQSIFNGLTAAKPQTHGLASQKPLTEPLSSFIPMTGSGASGCSSLARLLLFLSSLGDMASLPSFMASWSFMPCFDPSACGSRAGRFTAWSRGWRPPQPGRLSWEGFLAESESAPELDVDKRVLVKGTRGRR